MRQVDDWDLVDAALGLLALGIFVVGLIVLGMFG